jgi:penicillin-binding protein 2
MIDTVEPQGKLSLPTILFRVTAVLIFVGLAAQLWRLQIVEGREHRKRAEENHIRDVRLQAPRGVIYDRHLLEGKTRILASNAPIFLVSIVPADLPKGREQDVFDRLSVLLDMPPEQIQDKVQKQRAANEQFSPVPIKANLPRTVALKIDEAGLELPGVGVSVESTRRYAEGALFSHLLGYTALISPTLLAPEQYRRLTSPEGGYSINDRIGADGLEEKYESLLRGRFGRKRLEVEASGRQRELGVADDPQPGSNLVLSLDLDLQRQVDQMLREGLHNSKAGVAIVMDPRNGEILSLVSQPGYDNNVFTDDARDDELASLLTDPEQPFFHRAAAGLYPPGSTFKLITAVAALQEGVASRDTVIESRGAIYFDNDRYPGANASQRLPEWNNQGLGRLNFIQAIANSSNIYFFILGGGFEKEYPSGPLKLGLGSDRIARYARMFGYGAPTGIDLTDESRGTVPDETWKLAKLNETWFKGDTYNMSIGQGFVQATPLQVANVTTAIANGGTLYQPHLLRAVVDAEGQVTQLVEPRVIRTVDVNPVHIATLREAMEAGFSTGALLPPFRVPGLRVAGKTGTGEFAGEVNAQGELPTHGWFTGFAPADDPKISVTVFVELGSGSKDAAPIAMKIFRHYFGIPEDAQAPPVPTPTTNTGPQLPAPAPAQPQPVQPAARPTSRAVAPPAPAPQNQPDRPARAATPAPAPKAPPASKPAPGPAAPPPAPATKPAAPVRPGQQIQPPARPPVEPAPSGSGSQPRAGPTAAR